MDKRLNELMLKKQARVSAENAIKQASGHSGNASGGTYLVNDFRRRDDLPETASLRRMSNTVAFRLAELGFRVPISLQALPNFWWKVKLDAAEVGLVSEYGGCFVTRTLSTASLMDMGFEVTDGPYSAWENEDVSRVILREFPGMFWDARIYKSAVVPEQEGRDQHCSGYDNAYPSERLMMALDQGESIEVFSGPFDTEDDARYALDVRWEVPD